MTIHGNGIFIIANGDYKSYILNFCSMLILFIQSINSCEKIEMINEGYASAALFIAVFSFKINVAFFPFPSLVSSDCMLL